jgi:hypothetical protein
MMRHHIDVHGTDMASRETLEVKNYPPLEGQVFRLVTFSGDWKSD